MSSTDDLTIVQERHNIGQNSKMLFDDTVHQRRPTPLNFDEFVPWLCRQWQVPNDIIITRIATALSRRRKSSLKSPDDQNNSEKPVSSRVTFPTLTNTTIGIPVTTYYNIAEQLTEVAINNCPVIVPKKLIQAINICIPFHASLTRLKITKGGIKFDTLNEVRKLLPLSNITELCLDSNNVAQGNYCVLIDQISQLKYLSLNRCGINDDVCKELSNSLKIGRPASKSLAVLSLSMNDITDGGAISIAECLRDNRKLRHLNLCGNKISDVGAAMILDYLKEFPLTHDEILETNRRKLEHMKKKKEIYRQCLNDVATKLIEPEESVRELITVPSKLGKRGKVAQKNIKKTKRQSTKNIRQNVNINTDDSNEQQIAGNLAEIRTKEIVGEFKDIFNRQNTTIRQGYKYAIGNLAVSSLNLAHNNIGYLSIKKIYEVLKYQSQFMRSQENTGLLRVVIDGNNLPIASEDLHEIDMCLKTAVTEMLAVHNFNDHDGHVTRPRKTSKSRSRFFKSRSISLLK